MLSTTQQNVLSALMREGIDYATANETMLGASRANVPHDEMLQVAKALISVKKFRSPRPVEAKARGNKNGKGRSSR